MKKVFLDANIVIEAGKPPYGPEFSRVIDLIEAGRIRILTTEITCAEVVRHHVRRDFNVIKNICNQNFRKMVLEIVNTELPMTTEKQLLEVLKENYRHLVNDMFKKMDAKLLEISKVKTHKVFYEYFNEIGLFADGRGKKHQFPDAFIFERLKDESSQKEPIIIVSNDRDFEQAANDQKNITLVKSLPDLFSELGLKLEDPEITQFLTQNYDEIAEMVNDELSYWELEGNIENSRITETDVISIDMDQTIAFKSAEKGGSILVAGEFVVQTLVGFEYPVETNFTFDPEVKPHIEFATMNDQREFELLIDVSLSIAVDDKGDPEKIEGLEFRNGDFAFIRLDPHGRYW